jgi:hypothetical protein
MCVANNALETCVLQTIHASYTVSTFDVRNIVSIRHILALIYNITLISLIFIYV